MYKRQPLEAWAAEKPIFVISQAFVDGESAGDDYLASVSSKTYDGKSANGDITDVLDKTLKQVGIAGEIAPKLSLIHISHLGDKNVVLPLRQNEVRIKA